MALLCFNSFTPLFSSVSVSSGTMMAVVPRVHVKLIDMPSKCLSGIRISTPFPLKRTDTFIARAAASGDDGGSTAEGEKEVVSVDKLPLESKLKEREEQKLRMKLAKKIRLRRKRLVRKRHLRKKGSPIDHTGNSSQERFTAKGQNFRHNMYPSYKSNRPPTPDTIVQELQYLKASVKAMSIKVIEVPGVEADDLIGTLALRSVDAGYKVRVVSPDRLFPDSISSITTHYNCSTW